ncbi:MAG: RNA pseudouridine synthase, partial [Myxococcota bacterium]|nr:RNA pseudouridine synthase [Myxococcota bacterium]
RVHPAGDDGVPDLLTWLRTQAGLPSGTAPVQRLDQGTSGLLLAGATPSARAAASAWLAEHRVEKTYLTVVHGRARKKGTLRRALPDGRRGRPLPAVTRYRTLEWLGGFSLLAVQIETGRKHQIRRHLHGIGHPVVGDPRYRRAGRRRVPGWAGRMWLHARVLVLPGGETFEDPLPPSLLASLDAMRAGAADAP